MIIMLYILHLLDVVLILELYILHLLDIVLILELYYQWSWAPIPCDI